MMTHRLQSNRWLFVSALLLLPALIGSFAACILCDTDLCCASSDCAGDACYCACAFYAASTGLAPATPLMNANGVITHGHLSPPPQESPRGLYRPPRVLARA